VAKVAKLSDSEYLQLFSEYEKKEWDKLKAIRQKLFPPTGSNKTKNAVPRGSEETAVEMTIRHNQDTLTLLDDTVTIRPRQPI
jgi:hypothetical protein